MATPELYGVGLDVSRGWPKRFTYASGFRNLGNNLARRLQTIRGSLPWDPNCGFNLRGLFWGSLTQGELAALGSIIGAECEKDERVDSASAVVTYVSGAQVLIVTITVTGADGPFLLVLSVSDLSVDILRLDPNP